jgi:uncharacterized protein (DUF433 family)
MFSVANPMNWREHIVVDPSVLHGTACFKGTRIPVTVVLDNLAAGVSEDALRAEYPTLPPEAVAAAIAYAAELAKEQVWDLPA